MIYYTILYVYQIEITMYDDDNNDDDNDDDEFQNFKNDVSDAFSSTEHDFI